MADNKKTATSPVIELVGSIPVQMPCRAGEKALEYGNNAVIFIGRDRGTFGVASVVEGYGGANNTKSYGKRAGAILLDVGRTQMGGDPDFKKDGAYIYLSMQTDPDMVANSSKVEGLTQIKAEEKQQVPAIISRSNFVRLAYRDNFKILNSDPDRFVYTVFDNDSVVVNLKDKVKLTLKAKSDDYGAKIESNGSYIEITNDGNINIHAKKEVNITAGDGKNNAIKLNESTIIDGQKGLKTPAIGAATIAVGPGKNSSVPGPTDVPSIDGGGKPVQIGGAAGVAMTGPTAINGPMQVGGPMTGPGGGPIQTTPPASSVQGYGEPGDTPSPTGNIETFKMGNDVEVGEENKGQALIMSIVPVLQQIYDANQCTLKISSVVRSSSAAHAAGRAIDVGQPWRYCYNQALKSPIRGNPMFDMQAIDEKVWRQIMATLGDRYYVLYESMNNSWDYTGRPRGYKGSSGPHIHIQHVRGKWNGW